MKKQIITILMASTIVSASFCSSFAEDSKDSSPKVDSSYHSYRPIYHVRKYIYNRKQTTFFDGMADTAQIQIGGSIDVNYVNRTQSYNYENSNLTYDDSQSQVNNQPTKSFVFSPNAKKYAFYSKSRIYTRMENHTDTGLTYGVFLMLQTVSNRDRTLLSGNNRSYLYLEQENLGRFEFGTHDSPSRLLAVNASTIATGNDGSMGTSLHFISKLPDNFIDLYAPNTYLHYYSVYTPQTFINQHGDFEDLKRVNYYTPQINGIQVGVSYAFDTEGSNFPDAILDSFNNQFSAAAKYETNLDDNSKFAVSALYDHAKAVPSSTETPYNVNSWELGSRFIHKNLRIAGSYGNVGKGGVDSAYSQNWKSHYYTAGIAYQTGALTSSVTYMATRTGDSVNPNIGTVKNSLLSIGMDYQVAYGFLPYMSVDFYNMKYSLDDKIVDPKYRINNKGRMLIAGIRITL